MRWAVVVWLLLLTIAALARGRNSNNNDATASEGTLAASQLYADLSEDSGAPHLDTLLDAIEPKLQALYWLCRADAVCANNFYLSATSSSASGELTGNEAARRLQAQDSSSEQKKFNRLLISWAQRDDCPLRPNAVRDQLTLSDYADTDAAWWLTVMNTVRFCGDNQDWEMGRGCVMKPDRVDDDGTPVRARSTLDSVGQPLTVLAVVIFSILILAAIVAGVYVANQAFHKMVKNVRALDRMSAGMSPRQSLQATSSAGVGRHSGGSINSDYSDDYSDDSDFSAAEMVAHVLPHH